MIDDIELEFIERVENEFDGLRDVTLKVTSYPDGFGHRVRIITDQDGDELARLTDVDGMLKMYLPISNDLFTSIHNWDRQFERFWLSLYEKYKLNKHVYYKKHNIKRLH